MGSYWKGRKPLILAKACILGCLLPATGNPAKDLEIFEKLMGIDDDAFAIRANLKADDIVRTISLDDIDPLQVFRFNRPKGEEPKQFPYVETEADLNTYGALKAAWKPKVLKVVKYQLQKRSLKKLKPPYMQKLEISTRPEEVGDALYAGIWKEVNKHLGTNAHTIPELVAKAFLYCLETRCPQTGWMVPMAPSWVISMTHRVYAKLVPNHEQKQIGIGIITGTTLEEMTQVIKGTVRDGSLIYQLNGEEYVTRIRTLRGDRKVGTETVNNLRQWQKLL